VEYVPVPREPDAAHEEIVELRLPAEPCGVVGVPGTIVAVEKVDGLANIFADPDKSVVLTVSGGLGLPAPCQLVKIMMIATAEGPSQCSSEVCFSKMSDSAFKQS